VIIGPLDPADPRVRALLDASDRYMNSLYPAESNHLESVAALQSPNVLFIGATLDDALIGCGAVKIQRDDGLYGEIKRVFVLPEARGRGISRAIMQVLERHLVAQGVRLARLEAGISQPEALGLYRRLGYVERTPFGAYRPDPLSVFMEKGL
jgi:putative acetyltransferase